MSKIPYQFSTPIPRFFRDKGYFKNPKNLAFVTWSFSLCSFYPYTLRKLKITLQPFQFLFGRDMCAEETGLTPNEIRTQINRWVKLGLLRKIPSKKDNLFSVFEWIISAFPTPKNHQPTDFNSAPHDYTSTPIPKKTKQNHQPITLLNPIQNHQPTFQNHQPTFLKTTSQSTSVNHGKPPAKKKTDHQPSLDLANVYLCKDHHHQDARTMDDDDFISIEIKTKAGIEKITMTKADHAECMLLKAGRGELERAVGFIYNSPRRATRITSWPNALRNWMIPSEGLGVDLEQNRSFAKHLIEKYQNGSKSGYKCDFGKNDKQAEGLLFYHPSSQGTSGNRFLGFRESDFEHKCLQIIAERGMSE